MIRHKFSQVFLANRSVADRVVRELLNHSSSNRVLEIGPGKGALTSVLLSVGCEVVAVEIDKDLASDLKKLHGPLTVIQDSILNHNPYAVVDKPAVVIGSLPYHLSGAILRWTADYADYISMAVFILQDEVVGRIGALPGDRKRGLLSVVMQSVYDVSPLFRISPGSFYPRPQVWSRVVRLNRGGTSASVSSMRPVWDVASLLFRQRRKMIGGLLSRVYGKDVVEHIKALGVDLTRRPETLTLPELEMITQVIQEMKYKSGTA